MKIKKVLVVEDERMFREFLVGWLKGEGYEVVGEAGDVAGARALSEGGEVDLVLLDMDLPDGSGMGYVDWQVARRPTTRILVLTAHVMNYPVMKLKRSGVMGVLDKGETSGEELKRAFAALGEWRTYYSERVERSFRELVQESTAFYKTLSEREEEMLKLFGRGMSNEGIAGHLRLSVATVQGHRRNVMAKVGVRSTPELIIWAIRNGFVLGPQLSRMGGEGEEGKNQMEKGGE
ncbi:MAG: response regulator transcription factor [Oceanipulchritudo sp.]